MVLDFDKQKEFGKYFFRNNLSNVLKDYRNMQKRKKNVLQKQLFKSKVTQ